MIRVLAGFIAFLFMHQLQAQQVYFIYIQSENRKPFYARMNSKVISSTAGGYLLIPKLQNGGYRAAIGFPGKTGNEEEFLFTIDNADLGFDLKETPGGTGHVLFNLLNYKIENPVADAGVTKGKDSVNGNNFGDLLADVVKDPTVKNIDPVKPPEPVKPPPVAEKPLVKEEIPVPADTMKQPVVIEEKKIEPVVEVKADTPMRVNNLPEKPVPEIKPPAITGAVKVLFKQQGKEGTDLVFADLTNGSNDTIRVFMPRLTDDTLTAVTTPAINQPPEQKKEIIPPPVEEKKELPPPVEEKKEVPPPAETKKEPPFLDIQVKNPNEGVKPGTIDTLAVVAPKTDSGSAPRKLVLVNTDCKKIANEEDFVKLRKKMAGEKTNEEMMSVAVKTFRTKCFTSEQVKNLSVLLMGDEGKYRFYDMAYPFVYDTENFPQLEQQLTDLYYKNRFRALIRKP